MDHAGGGRISWLDILKPVVVVSGIGLLRIVAVGARRWCSFLPLLLLWCVQWYVLGVSACFVVSPTGRGISAQIFELCLIHQQPGAVRCGICNRWFAAAGGLARHRCDAPAHSASELELSRPPPLLPPLLVLVSLVPVIVSPVAAAYAPCLATGVITVDVDRACLLVLARISLSRVITVGDGSNGRGTSIATGASLLQALYEWRTHMAARRSGSGVCVCVCVCVAE